MKKREKDSKKGSGRHKNRIIKRMEKMLKVLVTAVVLSDIKWSNNSKSHL